MRTESQGKYRFLIVPGHPMSDSRGRVLEHRYVMSQLLGRPLLRNEVVHHKDENRLNNEPSNLELLTSSEHTKHHHPIDLLELECMHCAKPFNKARRNKRGARVFCSRSCSTRFYGPPLRPQTGVEAAHGTYSRYRKGCHCDDCRKANTARIKAGRERGRAQV